MNQTETTQEQIEAEIKKIEDAQKEVGNIGINTIKNYCDKFQDVISDLRNHLNTEHGQEIAEEIEDIVDGDLDINLSKLKENVDTLVNDIKITYTTVSRTSQI